MVLLENDFQNKEKNFLQHRFFFPAFLLFVAVQVFSALQFLAAAIIQRLNTSLSGLFLKVKKDYRAAIELLYNYGITDNSFQRRTNRLPKVSLFTLIATKNWEAVKDRIVNDADEICYSIMLKDVLEDLPLDIRFRIDKITHGMSSIYLIDYDFEFVENNFKEFAAFENPKNDLNTLPLCLRAINTGKKSLAKKLLSCHDDSEFIARIAMLAIYRDLPHAGIRDTIFELFPNIAFSPMVIHCALHQQNEHYIRDIIRLMVENKLAQFQDFQKQECRQRATNALREIIDGKDSKFMVDRSFVIALSRVIREHRSDICEHCDILVDSGLMYHIMRHQDVDFIRFVARRCPKIYYYKNWSPETFKLLAANKWHESLSALLGVGAEHEDMHLYPNELDDELMRALRFVLYTFPDKTPKMEDAVKFSRICSFKFPNFTQSLFIDLARPVFLCSDGVVELAENISKNLSVDLSLQDKKTGLTPILSFLGSVPLYLKIRDINECSSDIRRTISFLIKSKSNAENPATIQNPDGRLPLHTACALGIDWALGVDIISDSYPVAVLLSDEVTCLKPFALAAACDADTSTCRAASLDTIYELLRIDPSMIPPI